MQFPSSYFSWVLIEFSCVAWRTVRRVCPWPKLMANNFLFSLPPWPCRLRFSSCDIIVAQIPHESRQFSNTVGSVHWRRCVVERTLVHRLSTFCKFRYVKRIVHPSRNHRTVVIDAFLIFELRSHTLLGYICYCWTVFLVVTFLDNDCSLQQIHTISIEIRMGASANGTFHQRVSDHWLPLLAIATFWIIIQMKYIISKSQNGRISSRCCCWCVQWFRCVPTHHKWHRWQLGVCSSE